MLTTGREAHPVEVYSETAYSLPASVQAAQRWINLIDSAKSIGETINKPGWFVSLKLVVLRRGTYQREIPEGKLARAIRWQALDQERTCIRTQ